MKRAQLRMQCSKLNAHLFELHVIDSPECICGFELEDSYHYLLLCPLYNAARHKMFNTIGNKTGFYNLDVDVMLFGLPNEVDSNKHIFSAVHTFIKDTGRL